MNDLRALILDFDGLIVDTEMAEYQSWRDLYAEHGASLEVEDWLKAVGYVNGLDPRAHLESITGRRLDWSALNPRRQDRAHELADALPMLPGVDALISQGEQLGYRLGIASNSTLPWVERGLRRLGLWERIPVVRTRETVANPKPQPDIYLRVLADLGASAAGSIAFEDSEPGILAAKAAGLYVVNVPNALTRHQNLSAADESHPTLEGYELPR